MITMEYLKENVKNWDGKLYKVFNDGHTPINGSRYHWSLPRDDGTPGEWTDTIEDVEMCKKGWHLTTHYAHWLGRIVYEAESDSIVEFDGYDKVVCKRVRLVRLVVDFALVDNSGDCNSGSCNSGDCNTGDRNTGDRNSGYCNSGGYNSGDNNSGNRNSGDCSSGDCNTGHHNGGYCNSGSRNSGNRNSGSCNTGNSNSGGCNSGDRNSGDRNSGSLNSGSWCTTGPLGCLCTERKLFLFNKPVDEMPSFPEFFYFNLIDGDMKKSWRIAFDNARHEEIVQLVNLPNFDYGVFEEISGIAQSDIEQRLATAQEVEKR